MSDSVYVPLLGELVRDLHPVLRRFLDPDLNPYQEWYPSGSDGELHRAAALEAFVIASREETLAPYMPLMAHANKREGTPPHPAIGSPGAAYLFGGKDRNLNLGSDIICPIWFGERVRVRLAAKLIGPILACDDVRISSNTGVIRCVIGSRSVIDDGANLKDSIVGADGYVGVGAKLLSKEVSRVPVTRPKMGCVIGDGCRVGAGVTLMPGTILLPGTEVPEHAGTIPTGIYDQAAIKRLLAGR